MLDSRIMRFSPPIFHLGLANVFSRVNLMWGDGSDALFAVSTFFLLYIFVYLKFNFCIFYCIQRSLVLYSFYRKDMATALSPLGGLTCPHNNNNNNNNNNKSQDLRELEGVSPERHLKDKFWQLCQKIAKNQL